MRQLIPLIGEKSTRYKTIFAVHFDLTASSGKFMIHMLHRMHLNWISIFRGKELCPDRLLLDREDNQETDFDRV